MADVMYVNINMFMITSARKIKFITIEHIQSRTYDQILKTLNKMINLYGRGGFTIILILMDMEFDRMAELLGNVVVNV